MTKFYICRHGETESNRAKRHQGWIDTPLTLAGRMNAEAVATKLKGKHIDKIVSSDLGRAFISAYIISRAIGYNDEIEVNSQLREVNYGEFANTGYDEFPNIEPGAKSSFIFPGGESQEQMQDRVVEALRTINDKYSGKTILIVGHDGTINSIRAVFTGQSIAEADSVSSSHDFIAEFVYSDGRIRQFMDLITI